MNIIVAGIGTDVGKTIISAILCKTFDANYWKPVQAGDLKNSDSIKIQRLVDDPNFITYPEAYRLTHPLSPHASAAMDDLYIDPNQFKCPDTSNKNLVIELAGGLMVPLNDNYLTLDLAADLLRANTHPPMVKKSGIVLVANFYLGSINHTLLSIELLKGTDLNILGIIFNGEPNLESRDVILKYSKIPLIADIPHSTTLDQAFITHHAQHIRDHTRLA